MKKTVAPLVALFIIIAFSCNAFAWQPSGLEYPTNLYGQYSDTFAPNTCTSVNLGTKGFVNVDVTNSAAYKFWFTATAAGTAIVGAFKTAALSAWSNGGTVKMTSEQFAVGKNVTAIGFANYSSQTAGTVTYCLQKGNF